jgi:hypothetical protein
MKLVAYCVAQLLAWILPERPLQGFYKWAGDLEKGDFCVSLGGLSESPVSLPIV